MQDFAIYIYVTLCHACRPVIESYRKKKIPIMVQYKLGKKIDTFYVPRKKNSLWLFWKITLLTMQHKHRTAGDLRQKTNIAEYKTVLLSDRILILKDTF